jgi:hypothetical protein
MTNPIWFLGSYFRHASGQMYALSKDLATYVSINQSVTAQPRLLIVGRLMQSFQMLMFLRARSNERHF